MAIPGGEVFCTYRFYHIIKDGIGGEWPGEAQGGGGRGKGKGGWEWGINVVKR